MSGDDCLPVCLYSRLTIWRSYLRCVASSVKLWTRFHTYERRQASTLDETLELKKFQLRRPRQRFRIVYFCVITRHCKIILAPARTFVAMDEEKLIKAERSFPSLLKVTMKCYKHVMLKKMLEKKWRSVELSICRKWASRSARRISCNMLYSPCFLRSENIGRTHMLRLFFRRRRSAISKSNSNSSSLPELWSTV